MADLQFLFYALGCTVRYPDRHSKVANSLFGNKEIIESIVTRLKRDDESVSTKLNETLHKLLRTRK